MNRRRFFVLREPGHQSISSSACPPASPRNMDNVISSKSLARVDPALRAAHSRKILASNQRVSQWGDFRKKATAAANKG